MARLRIGVFREFPYLYEGDAEYEEKYLQTYISAPDAAVVIAEAEGKVVGASTCLQLAAETPNVQKPFLDAGLDVGQFLYFGESVLDKAYRGLGIGVAFFAHREAQAQMTGRSKTCFCAVQRPARHRLRPADYVPLDAFWRKRGYTKREDLVCRMRWREVDEAAESEKELMFWTKELFA